MYYWQLTGCFKTNAWYFGWLFDRLYSRCARACAYGIRIIYYVLISELFCLINSRLLLAAGSFLVFQNKSLTRIAKVKSEREIVQSNDIVRWATYNKKKRERKRDTCGIFRFKYEVVSGVRSLRTWGPIRISLRESELSRARRERDVTAIIMYRPKRMF